MQKIKYDDLYDCSPALARLPTMKQRFVRAKILGAEDYEAACQAGYAMHNKGSAKVRVSILRHDPDIAVALLAEGETLCPLSRAEKVERFLDRAIFILDRYRECVALRKKEVLRKRARGNSQRLKKLMKPDAYAVFVEEQKLLCENERRKRRSPVQQAKIERERARRKFRASMSLVEREAHIAKEKAARIAMQKLVYFNAQGGTDGKARRETSYPGV